MNENHAAPPPTPTALCAAYAPQLALLDAGMLEPDEERGVRAHASTCAWCQAKLAIFALVDDALRRNFSVPSDPSGTRPVPTLEAIMTQSEHETAAADSSNASAAPDSRHATPRRRYGFLAAACLAALVVVTGGVFVLYRPHPMEGRQTQPPRGTAVFALPTRYAGPQGPVVGPDGNIWFVEVGANKIGRITPDGAIKEFALPPRTYGPVVQLVAGPDGNLWFTAGGGTAAAIGRITPSGRFTFFPINLLNSVEVLPGGIAVGQDGNLWFTAFMGDGGLIPGSTETRTSMIGRITPAGAVNEYALLTTDLQPGGITSGPGGNLWFTLADLQPGGKRAAVGVINPNSPGDSFQQFPLPATGRHPIDIVEGPDGNLWFPELQSTVPDAQHPERLLSAAIGRMMPDGAVREFPIPGGGTFAYDITVGPDGNLWASLVDTNSTDGAGVVARITLAGIYTLFSQFPLSVPTGLVWGPDGNLWVTEAAGNATKGAADVIARLHISG